MVASDVDLEQSLRAEVDGYTKARLSGLQEEIARLQSQLNEAFRQLSERLSSEETQSDSPVSVAISEHLRSAYNKGIEAAKAESSRARASSDIAIIKAAVDDIDNQRSQADILNALVNRSSSFAPRVAFFVIKNDRVTGWRARGLEGTVGDDTVREISLSLSSDTLLSEAARSRSTWSGSPGSHAEDREIFARFGGNPPQRIISIPLIAREKAVAVLYADSAEMEPDAINLEALEILVRVAGMAVELLATKRPEVRKAVTSPAPAFESRVQTMPATEQEARREVPTSQTEPEPETSAPPFMPVPLEPIAQQPPVVEETAPASAIPTESETTSEPSPASFAEPAYSEAVTEAPAPVVEPPSSDVAATPAHATTSPLGAAKRYGSDAALPIEVGEEEKRIHNDARRFARLLVSEIKLYNEQKVRDGRAEGDLYSRLREDIDRSRQMYDKRVAPEVAARYDYFHHELVTTLAEGDPSKLGADYPGPTVAAQTS